jgi:hypothetical protein
MPLHHGELDGDAAQQMNADFTEKSCSQIPLIWVSQS